MTRDDRPPYFLVKNGRAFFELGRKRAALADMASSTPLGRDSKSARAAAWKLYYEWLDASGRKEKKTERRRYPEGSFGSWYMHYRRLPAWKRKAPATKQEWEAAWKYVEPYLADKGLRKISPTDVEVMFETLEQKHGVNIRWRAIKLTRALFNAAIKHELRGTSPALTLPNTPPPGRTEIWLATEIITLIKTADEINRPAMKLALCIGWETLFSPVDIRTLTLSNRFRDGAGAYFKRNRQKSGTEAFGYVSNETNKLIDEYVATLPVTLMDDQPFLRTVRGHRYTKARFLDDFRLVRLKAFGPDEKRRFQDIRRSGNVEADLADASPEDRAEILANSLHKDKFLEQTYTPPTVAKARKLAEKRLIGRRMLTGQSWNTTG